MEVDNMATTLRNILIEALHPGMFEKDDDVKTFTARANRYFDASGIQKTIRGVLVISLIHKDLRNKYEVMKEALTTTPVLCYPDLRRGFILNTDARFEAMGAVLSQKDDNGKERVIAYGSHALSAHEKRYCFTRKELLAIYYRVYHKYKYIFLKYKYT